MNKRLDVADWAILTSPGEEPWVSAPHLEEINRRLMRVVTGECRRLIIEAPPRHGKSELVSRKFPSFYLGNFPNRQVIMASHNAGLATGFSRNSRDLMERFGPPVFGYGVRPDKKSEDDWGLIDRNGRNMLGTMRAFGVGGGMLGEGAHLLIVDDPITGDDSLSPTMRMKVWDWWRGTAMDRLNPGGKSAIVLMAQRLHERDLIGMLMEAEPDAWEVLTLRAEAEEDDVLGRNPGEWLWPWGFKPKEYEANRRGNPYWWASKYQQRPVPRGGGMIQTAWIEDNAVHYIPDFEAGVRWWDRAATEGGGDWTAGPLMVRKNGHFYIIDMEREQLGSGNRDRLIRATCDRDNKRFPNLVTTWSEQEPGSAGKDMALSFERMLAPFPAHCQVSTGSKEVRADGFAGACARGEVHVYKGPEKGKKWGWYDALVAELTSFPAGKNDDQMDGCSGAYNKLALADGDRQSEVYDPSEHDLMAEYGTMEVTF